MPPHNHQKNPHRTPPPAPTHTTTDDDNHPITIGQDNNHGLRRWTTGSPGTKRGTPPARTAGNPPSRSRSQNWGRRTGSFVRRTSSWKGSRLAHESPAPAPRL